MRQWSKFKGERRENEKEGKRKFWRDGKKVGAELWKKGVEVTMKREIVRERLREEVEERESRNGGRVRARERGREQERNRKEKKS